MILLGLNPNRQLEIVAELTVEHLISDKLLPSGELMFW